MADYILQVPITTAGIDMVDPYDISALISEATYMIPAVTNNNLTVETIDFDAEAKQIYYSMNASSVMKMGLALGDLVWYHTLFAGAAIGAAVVCAIYAAPVAAAGLAIVAGVALLYDPITQIIEVQASKAETKAEIVRLAGEPGTPFYENPELLNDYLNAVDSGWGTELMEAVKWMIILIGGAVALQIVLPIITKIGKKE